VLERGAKSGRLRLFGFQFLLILFALPIRLASPTRGGGSKINLLIFLERFFCIKTGVKKFLIFISIPLETRNN
jgi:hypothetical protein